MKSNAVLIEKRIDSVIEALSAVGHEELLIYDPRPEYGVGG